VSPSFWIAMLLWTVGLTFFAALAAAVPEASRTRLHAALRRRGREGWLERFEQRSGDYATTASCWAWGSALLLILFIDRGLGGVYEKSSTHVVAVGACSLALLLVAGVAIPRGIARHRAEALVAASLLILEFFRILSFPVVCVTRLADEIVRRLAGMPPPDEEDAGEELEREILDIVSAAQTSGAVGATETRVIRSVMDLNERTVGQIMTPRTEVLALDVHATLREAREAIVSGGHSRIPVYEGNIDSILGVLYAKDLLRVSHDDAVSIRSLMRSVPFVPETKVLPELLREFQTTRVHVAIVLDEYGGTAGLVTLEDILEELIGEIADEHEAPEPQAIHRVDEQTVDVDARVRIDELNAALNLHLPEDDAYDTVAGLVLSQFGRIPAAGESLAMRDLKILVLAADDRRISRLRILLPHEAVATTA